MAIESTKQPDQPDQLDELILPPAEDVDHLDLSVQPTPITPDDVCERLLAFIGDQTPKKELPSVRLPEFYNSFAKPEEAKAIITECKKEGHLQGIRSFCGMFPTKLAYRKAYDKTDKASILILRMCDLKEAKTQSDRVNRMACKLAMSYNKVGREDSGRNALRIIEKELAALKLDLGSMNKLTKEVKARGICLRDGSEHGAKLRSALKYHRALPVDKELAKKFPHAKKCLVTI